MVYFDKKTLSILKFIKHSGKNGVTWQTILNECKDKEVSIQLLENLTREKYIVTQNECGEWVDFKTLEKQLPIHQNSHFKSFATPKGNELIDLRCFNFWKWVIPTVISIISLVISTVSFWINLLT